MVDIIRRGRFLTVIALAAVLTLATAVGAFAQTIPGADEQTWVTYENPRFSVIAPVPQIGFAAKPPPTNGDGQGYVAAGGAVEVSVYGSYWDVLVPTFDDYRQWLRGIYDDRGAKITYEPSGETWFVLSGYLSDRRVFYEKVTTRPGCSIAGAMYVEFDEDYRAPMETIIGYMENGLRLGPSQNCPD